MKAGSSLASGLYIVSTPIGNLRDVTLRALDVLGAADVVLAEDTRITARLFSAYEISTALTPYHDHNAAEVRPAILEKLRAGGRIALVSDAGTPMISDPGYKLAREAAEAGVPVFPIPGASALLAGLAASGLPTDRFLFAGFAPAKSGKRQAFFREVKDVPASLVFYETGPRLAASLADMLEVFGDREAAVARELTKAFEETRRGLLADLAAHYAEAGGPKGEIVVLLGPPAEETEWSEARIDRALAEAMNDKGVKEAAADVAALTGLSRRDLYQRALKLKTDI